MDLNEPTALANLVEALLLAHNQPLSLERIESIFEEHERPAREDIQQALQLLAESCQMRSFELKEVATGYRLQVKNEFAAWVGRLWEEKPQRYSRALLETLALIAYRQPITRGEIEDIRGVAVNSQIIKTLQEREWVRIVGYKDVPGKPAMLATTKAFLDYFNLKSLEELPALSSIRSVEDLPVFAGELFESVEEHQEPSPIVSSGGEPIQLSDKQDTHEKVEKNFKQLLEEWDEMEQGVKTDFSDMIETKEQPNEKENTDNE